MKQRQIKRITQAVSSAIILAAAGQAAAFDFTAGGVEASVYGYARLNATYDIDEAFSTSTRSGNFADINTGAAEDNEVTGHFGADAVQSRIGVTAKLPNEVKVNIEGDFRPGTLRLRHAYGQYGNILAGQTWSNFTSFVGGASILEFDGLVGAAGNQGRVAQVRYTSGPFSVSAEEVKTTVFDVTNFAPVKKGLPTLTARYEASSGPVAYSVAGVVHQIGIDNGTSDDTAMGGAAFAAVTFKATDALSLKAVINVSEGANAYLYRSGENGFSTEDAYIDTNGELETLSGIGGNVNASLKVSPKGTVNFGYGFAEVDWDDAADEAAASGIPAAVTAVAAKHETNSLAFINYQYSPTAGVMYGVEYALFDVEEVGGDDGDASKIQFAAQYSF